MLDFEWHKKLAEKLFDKQGCDDVRRGETAE